VPNLAEVVAGLVPVIPDGGLLYTLSLAGGVGGTITLAAYGYWLREKGWDTPRFMRVMRIDNTVAYTVTGLFVVATLIVGAELLYSAQIAVATGDEGMLDLSRVLENRYGTAAGTVFLVGFWAAAMSSLVGVWNGVSLMFADFVGHVRGLGADHPDSRAGGKYYRGYILWLTLPPIALIFMGEPVYLILATASLVHCSCPSSRSRSCGCSTPTGRPRSGATSCTPTSRCSSAPRPSSPSPSTRSTSPSPASSARSHSVSLLTGVSLRR
jgi:hypothetical protein